MLGSKIQALTGSILLAATLSFADVQVIFVPSRPPRPVREVVVVRPGPGHVWVRGYHRWEGGSYVWVPGHWQQPPRPRARWVPGRWRHERRGWYWTEGRWR
jgi:hypothetical protein